MGLRILKRYDTCMRNFPKLMDTCGEVCMGGCGGVGGGAHVILVSALGPNPSFPFFGDFYSTWGPVGTGARTWFWTRA